MFDADSYIKLEILADITLNFCPKICKLLCQFFPQKFFPFFLCIYNGKCLAFYILYNVSSLMSIRKKKKRTQNMEESLEESMVEKRNKKLRNQETYLSFRMLWRIFRPEWCGGFSYNSSAAGVCLLYYRYIVSITHSRMVTNLKKVVVSGTVTY
jgi:hypothetical protein